MAVGMVNVNASAFSPDLKHYANISNDGKLKIWDTENNVLKQEFTPNLHLNAPCTCLQWMKHTKEPPHKKRRKSVDKNVIKEDEGGDYTILLGTSDGSILLYSFNDGKITGVLGEGKTGHNGSITCLAWENSNFAYSCADDSTIIEWCLKSRRKNISWSSGKETPSSLLLISNKKRLLSAARTIQMWCLQKKTVLKVFTGHSSLINIMKHVTISNENGNNDTYVLSGSRNDRILNVWNICTEIKDKTPYASFQMEDIAYSLCADFNPEDNSVCLTTVTRSGVLHYYRHILNGKLSKPIKPKLTMQVVFDKQNSSNNKIQSISILTGHIVNEDLILIGHGTQQNMTFEKIKPQPIGKMQVLIRQDPYSSVQKSNEGVQKTKIPDTEGAEYLGPTAGHLNLKRSSGKKVELPMESRLENLSLAVDSSTKALPKYDNMSHLLIQGLHSKDKNILQGVLTKKDEKIIQNTVNRIPVQYLIPLMKELTSYIHGKTLSSQIGTTWLRILLQSHAAHLMSVGSETLMEILSPCLGLIETRLNILQPLSRLQGRLDLLINQISAVQDQNIEEYTEKNLLIYQDPESSESESDEIAQAQSSSDDNWDELSDEEQEEMVIDENNANENEITSESD